jgi:outer membrane biosynthesis protein TonB
VDVNRLRTGEKIAGVAAVLLFIDMFLKWYGVKGVDITISAWKVFSYTDLLMLLLILAALALVFIRGSGRTVQLPASLPLIVAGLGALTAIVVLLRLFDQPGPNELVTVRLFAYIGFLLVLAITYGAIQAGGGVDTMRAEAEALTPNAPAGGSSGSGEPPRPAGASSVAEPQGPPPPAAPAAPAPPPAAPAPPTPTPDPTPPPAADPAPPAPAPDPEPPPPAPLPDPPTAPPAPPQPGPDPAGPTVVHDEDDPPGTSPPRSF